MHKGFPQSNCSPLWESLICPKLLPQLLWSGPSSLSLPLPRRVMRHPFQALSSLFPIDLAWRQSLLLTLGFSSCYPGRDLVGQGGGWDPGAGAGWLGRGVHRGQALGRRPPGSPAGRTGTRAAHLQSCTTCQTWVLWTGTLGGPSWRSLLSPGTHAGGSIEKNSAGSGDTQKSPFCFRINQVPQVA